MKKNLELNPKRIKIQFWKIVRAIRRHTTIIFIVSVLSIYGFLIFQINQYSGIEPSEEEIAEQLNIIKRPKIDQETIDKIEQLEDQNVGVQSLFKSARDNPFEDN
jgi:hypothetical protein